MGHTDSSAHPPFTLPLLDWIDIPAGRVTLENDMGTHDVAPFKIAKYPVTNAQFAAFIADGGYVTDRWWEGLATRIAEPTAGAWSEQDCPRETVNWYEAMAFTRWLSAKTGLTVTLPTEMQWQWAAVGDTGWAYPYGQNFDKDRCNTKESGIGRTTPVTKYPKGAPPFGVMDMSGNVWEWMLNLYDQVGGTDVISEAARVLRGGSWHYDLNFVRAAFRYKHTPIHHCPFVGFRLAIIID